MTIAYFNKAVILFHLRKPFAAMKILEPYVEKLEELDEPLKSKIGLLMIVLLLSTNQYEKAYDTLNKFAKHVSASSDLFGAEEGFSANSNSNDLNNFNRMFKLISMLTEILNENVVAIPDDGVNIRIIAFPR